MNILHKINSSIKGLVIVTIMLLSFLQGATTYAQNLEWSTYLGQWGSGSRIVVDDSGNVYCTGVTNDKDLSTSGAHQEGTGGVYLLKFDENGKSLWGTYYGGNGSAEAIAFDKKGNIIITGYQQYEYHTEGRIFTTKGAYQENFLGPPNGLQSKDAFIAKYSTSGKLLWATLYGGLKQDQGLTITTDKDNNIYVAGQTYSDSGLASSNAHQSAFTGTVSGFIVKFTADGKREWGTYYGGKSWNYINDITVDPSGMVYIVGSIWRDPNDPNLYVTPGSFLDKYPSPGETIGYIAKFDPDGRRIWGTYYGGGVSEEVQSIAIDKNYNIYIAGYAGDRGNVVTQGTYQPELAGWYDVFLAKFDSSGKRQWGTYMGGESEEALPNIVLDKSGDVYIAFTTRSKHNIAGEDAYQYSLAGDGETSDAAIFKFTNDGEKLWSTYFGSGNREICYGIDVDKDSNVYITGMTYSKDNIATAGSFRDSLEGDRSGFIAKFSAPTIKDTTKDTSSISIKEYFNQQLVQVFPNPTNGKFNVTGLLPGTNHIRIYSVLGTCIYQSSINQQELTIDLSGKAKGMYIYRLKDVHGKLSSGKIMLE